MKEGLQLITTSFAIALNFSPHLTSYCSQQEEDQLFGANCDAEQLFGAHYVAEQRFGAKCDTYSTKWTCALRASPEYEPATMDKAVRWAIAS